jgi:hypothetical protein
VESKTARDEAEAKIRNLQENLKEDFADRKQCVEASLTMVFADLNPDIVSVEGLPTIDRMATAEPNVITLV